MSLSLVGLTIHDPNAAAIRLPARNAGSKVLVGIGNAFVILLFEFVLISVGIRIATTPELFNEALSFLVSLNFFECLSLIICNDVNNVFLQPVFVSFFEFGLFVAGFF